MSEDIKGLKRLKLLGKLVIILSNNKLIFKDMDRPNEHQTMKFLAEGKVDVHRTVEGAEKQYESKGILDLKKAAIDNAQEFVGAILEFAKNSLKEVTFDEPEYQHLWIERFPDKDVIMSLAQRTKDAYTIPPEAVERINNRERLSWKEAKGKINGYAAVFDQGKEIGILMSINERMFFVRMEDLEDNPISSIFEKLATPD